MRTNACLRLLLEGLHGLQGALAQLGSGLAMRSGTLEEALPALIQQLLQLNQQLQQAGEHAGQHGQVATATIGHVELLFHEEPLPQSAELEAKVEVAFREAAEQLGLSCGVQRFWGLTLYHPDDLPYAAYQQAVAGVWLALSITSVAAVPVN